MTKQRAEWWRYSNLVPIIFTAISTVVVVSGFIFTMNNKLDSISQKVDAMQAKNDIVGDTITQLKLQIQHVQDVSDGSASFRPL